MGQPNVSAPRPRATVFRSRSTVTVAAERSRERRSITRGPRTWMTSSPRSAVAVRSFNGVRGGTRRPRRCSSRWQERQASVASRPPGEPSEGASKGRPRTKQYPAPTPMIPCGRRKAVPSSSMAPSSGGGDHWSGAAKEPSGRGAGGAEGVTDLGVRQDAQRRLLHVLGLGHSGETMEARLMAHPAGAMGRCKAFRDVLDLVRHQPHGFEPRTNDIRLAWGRRIGRHRP